MIVSLLGGYFLLANIVGAGLFVYDKHQAQTRGWRVPEKTLQLSALLGGWIGGMWAMNQFKHKTVKQEFRVPYFICVGLNVACIVGGFVAFSTSPSVRAKSMELFNRSIAPQLQKNLLHQQKRYHRRS